MMHGLWALSQRYGVSINQIVAANELPNPNQLVIGQALVIPAPPQHTVRPGENLWMIAKRYGTTLQAIIQTNRIANPALIYPGQKLRIPEKPKRLIDVNAFTIQFGSTGAQVVRDVAEYLTYVSPFGYRIQADGSLEAVDDTATIQAATENGVVPMMAITNFSATEAGTGLAQNWLLLADNFRVRKF